MSRPACSLHTLFSLPPRIYSALLLASPPCCPLLSLGNCKVVPVAALAEPPRPSGLQDKWTMDELEANLFGTDGGQEAQEALRNYMLRSDFG